MKKAYTPEMLINATVAVDVRAQKLSSEDIDNVIDDAYAELCTVTQAFSDEEVVSLDEFYENNETTIVHTIEEDVVDIYDLYLTIEGKDKEIYDYGIEKIRDPKVIYKDNRYNGRVHIDLETLSKTVDNAIIKYYYIPTHTTETVYMDAQTWIALKSALGAAMYDKMHDVERNAQKRAEMARRAKAIIPGEPEDYAEPITGRIFTGLAH